MKIVHVKGGMCVKADLFSNDSWEQYTANGALAIADPPYGNIVTDKWDKIDAKILASELQGLALKLQTYMINSSHFCLWGGFGKPHDRAFYRTILEIEDNTKWQMAEHITWRKKRAYGTKWRCLAAREEMARFVLGDIKSPRYFNPPFSEESRGYKGFNKKYPAKSEYKRLTMVWDHASDMGQNKPHKCHKPEPLAKTQIEMCTDKGDKVIDLFAGSAQVSITAQKMERSFVCFEYDDEYFDRAVSALS